MNLRALLPTAPLAPAVLFVGLLAGCGASRPVAEPPPAAAPPEQAPSEPASMSEAESAPLTEIDTLERDLQQSEQNLDKYLAQHAAAMPPPPAPAADADAAAEEVAEDREQQVAVARPRKRAMSARKPKVATAAAPPASAGEALSDSPCAQACRALDSMRNSADRLCALTGSDHQRCQNAQARVAGAEHRVEGAECVCRKE